MTNESDHFQLVRTIQNVGVWFCYISVDVNKRLTDNGIFWDRDIIGSALCAISWLHVIYSELKIKVGLQVTNFRK